MNENDVRAAEELFPSGHQPPSDYGRPRQHRQIVCDKDVAVPMRDGVNVVLDVYRPDAAGRFPVLFAFGVHSKELQGHELPQTFPPQPSWSSPVSYTHLDVYKRQVHRFGRKADQPHRAEIRARLVGV